VSKWSVENGLYDTHEKIVIRDGIAVIKGLMFVGTPYNLDEHMALASVEPVC